MTTAAIRPVAIKIGADIKERVQRLAEARHRTPHWLMREAICQFVEREESARPSGRTGSTPGTRIKPPANMSQ